MVAGGIVGLKEHFGMPVIKPLLLQWCVDSWTDLQERKLLIVQGWGRCVVSLFDVHDPLKRMEAMRDVANQELDPAVDPEGEEPEGDGDQSEANAEDVDIQSSDEEKDDLDVSRPIAEPARRSSRVSKPHAAAAGSYMLNSQQIALTEDSES